MKVYLGVLIFSGILFSCSNNRTEDLVDSKLEDVAQNDLSESEGEKPDDMILSDTSYDMNHYSGNAEIATYSLKKARYNGVHEGEVVLIFVTEPFLIEKQVKADNPNNDNSVNVLKMNRIDRFATGLYDYSQFTSVFTPIEKFSAQYPLKVTFGSQDWCGQSFMQMNHNNGFDLMQRSYFESEGDTSFHIDHVILEDNIFNMLKTSVDLLPVGDFDVFPSAATLRNSHQGMKDYSAIGKSYESEGLYVYEYEIPALKRTVEIQVDLEQNNRIVSWKETYPTVFDGELRTSIYELKGVESMPYWKYNRVEDVEKRSEFKLIY